MEAPVERTLAYVHLVFAYGFARLGQADRARSLRAAAQTALDVGDRVNAFLVAALSARVDQALEGQPSDTPLPPELSGRLDELQSFERYKVDRLRQASAVLEPHERLDPVGAYTRGARYSRGDEFAGLRGVTDARALEAGLEPMIARATAPGIAAEERLRLLDGALDFLPLLPESRAVPELERMVRSLPELAPERRVIAQLLDLAQDELELRRLLLVGFAHHDRGVDRRQRRAHVVHELDRTGTIDEGIDVAHEGRAWRR